MTCRGAMVLGVCAILAGLLAGPRPGSAAERPSAEIPVTLSADEVTYDRELGIVKASGHVEVSHEDRLLFADTLTYNQRENVLTASGNVRLVEPSGEVVFSQYMELTGDLKDGVLRDIGVILSDRSLIAANGARRSGGNLLEMRKAVYSPCRLCPEDPTRPPLWQIKAVKVTHDKRRRLVEYQDAWLEIYGVPVAYTPYLAHPDPTVKRQSGLLAPTFGASSDLGFVARLPYFWNIAPDKDATLTPIITSNEGPALAGEYRQSFTSGEIKARGSFTEDSKDELRAHVGAQARFDIDPTWRWGLDVNRSTDDTYTRRYGFEGDNTLPILDDTLVSKAFVEGFRHRNYASAQAFAFQGLRQEDDAGKTPFVLPMLDFNHAGEPDRFGGRTNIDLNVLALTRTESTDSQRISLGVEWRRPWTGPLGDLYTLSLGVRGDLYHVSDLARPGKTDFDGFTDRYVPEAVLDWRYPLIREGTAVDQTVEPIVQLVYRPFGLNPSTIPNDDSQDFEFDDTNLFKTNRFTGLDRVEGGSHVSYGLKYELLRKGGGRATFLAGQSYRAKADGTFAKGSGLEDNFSDVVAKVLISPGRNFDLLYRTRLDKGDLKPRRHEIRASAGVKALNFSTNYVFFDKRADSEFPGREEITADVNSQLNRFWRARVRGIFDIASDDLREISGALVYENECLVVATDFRRTFFRDRDLEPTDSINIRLIFKTLGEVSTGIL